MSLITKLSFNREITYLTMYSINLNGVFPIRAQAHLVIRYLWIAVATYAVSYMCGLSIAEAFLKDYGFLINITIILNVLTSMVCYCTPTISLYKRRSLVKLIQLLDSGFYTYTDEHKFRVSTFSCCRLNFSTFSKHCVML